MDHGRITSVAELLQNHNDEPHPSNNNNNNGAPAAAGREFSSSIATAISSVNNNKRQESGSEHQTGKKKRRRVPVSCNVCRYRKLKCDRQSPCGSCRMLKMTSICQYESRIPPHFQQSVEKSASERGVAGDGNHDQQKHEENQYLKTRLHQAEKELSELKNNTGQGEQVHTTYRPLVYTNCNSGMIYRELLSTSDIFEDGINERVPGSQQLFHKFSRDDNNKYLYLIPKNDVCRELRAEFLSRINSVFNAIDEQTLDYVITRVSRLDDSADLSVLDLQHVSLVLIMSGLGKLSMGDRRSNGPINGLVTAVKEILNKPEIMRNANTTTIQTMYYLCVYHLFFAPRSERNTSDITMITSFLVQSAYKIGLHRDPLTYKTQDAQEVQKSRRVLWEQVIFIDSLQSLQNGTPLLIDLKYSDTSIDMGGVLIQWSALCREILDKIILMPPSHSISSKLLEKIDEKLSQFPSHIKGIFQLLFRQLQFKYTQTIRKDDKFDLIEQAVSLLQLLQQNYTEDDLLKHIGLNFSIEPWNYIVESMLDDEILSRGAGDGRRFLDLVRIIVGFYEFSISKLSTKEEWDTYLVKMEAMLDILRENLPESKQSKLIYNTLSGRTFPEK